ncbi:transcription elongation factor spt5 [Tulasnella sp. 403]|nr:transcription elongation factor spt5 [Tulasnella sp. 403]
MRRDSRRAFATDAHGYEIRVHDSMKELEGEGRKGTILHIHQSVYAFLHNRDIQENGGVFVTRARGLVSVAPKGRSAGPDLSKLNPAVHRQGGMVGSGMMSKGGKDKLVGVLVMVVQGPWKGYMGTIKDTNDQACRVELQTRNKIIMIEKAKLRRKGNDDKLLPLESAGGFNFGDKNGGPKGAMGPPPTPNARATPNPYSGGMTPGGGRRTDGRTPNPYADGGRTPGFADGGRTPGSNAWTASSRTPNPYAAGRTPNPYSNDGGRTPFGSFGGGRTPGRSSGGATPNPYTARSDPRVRPGTTPAGAGATSGGWGAPSSSDWGAANDDWGAQTPGPVTAPTPGVFANTDEWSPSNAQTPGVYTGAPTPYASAPTPGVHAHTPGLFAQTPGLYAQTPALGAPTPGITAPTPGPGHLSAIWTDSERPHWLVGVSNVWVTITHDGGESFHNGDFDGQEVIVLSTSDMSDSDGDFISTANCRMLSGIEKGQNRAIPVRFLEAVRPAAGDSAYVTKEGPLKGKVVHISHITGDVAFAMDTDYGLSGNATGDIAIPKDDLIKWSN